MNYFMYTSHHFTAHGRCELNKSTLLPMSGFIAQLVEHHTGIAEATGSNPVEARAFSGFFFPVAYIGKLTAMTKKCSSLTLINTDSPLTEIQVYENLA